MPSACDRPANAFPWQSVGPWPPPQESAAQKNGSVILPILAGGTKAPLYFVHGVGGGMKWGYANLARHLGADQPVHVFRCRGERGQPEHESIEEMAAEYVAALRQMDPKGPYHLGGYCFGGNVAFEMARQLHQARQKVGAIVLINSIPAHGEYDTFRWTPRLTWKFARNLCYWTARISLSPTARASELLSWKLRTVRRKVIDRLRYMDWQARISVDDLVDLAHVRTPAERKVWAAHMRAFYRYHPRSYPGPVLLLRTRGHQLFCNFQPDYGWGEFALGGVDVRVLPGEHESILQEPHVSTTAIALAGALNGSPVANLGILSDANKTGSTAPVVVSQFETA
jgi:thioesterase domain-containing protein